jgi:signal transduction histidine kinase
MPSPSPKPTADPAAYAAPRTSMRLSPAPQSRARRRLPVPGGGHFFEGTRLAADVAVKQERSRVASDLHDTVAQTLYGISLSAARVLALLERSETAQVQSVVEDLLHLANDGQTELRTLLHDLRSSDEFNRDQLQEELTGALCSQAADLHARAGCQVSLSIPDEPDLAHATKATLIRIAREALYNIAKHACATRVFLVLEVAPAEVMLLVADDGRGFDPSAAHPGHFGLHMMREHALAIAGALEVVSAPDRGTQIRVRGMRRRR